MPTPTYDLIASNVLSSSASSVTFSSIPATYRDLILVWNGTISVNGNLRARFNSDTGSNYSHVEMYGDGSGTGSTANTYANVFIGEIIGSSSDLENAIVQIMDYSATDKHKTTLIRKNRTANAGGGNAGTEAQAVRWASTSAINAIEIYVAGGNLQSGSSLYLFGIVS